MELPLKRARTEEENNGGDDVEMMEVHADAIVAAPARPPLAPVGSSRRAFIGRHAKHAPPTSTQYWEERFPGFPSFVHEAFAAKSRGPQCYEEFLQDIEKPGIETRICKENEDGEIVEEPRIVNWF